MARSVWKFKVPISNRPGFETVVMPERSEVVHVGHQGDDVYVWAIIDTTERESEVRKIGAFPTGFPVKTQSAAYHGTTEIHDGGIVLHVFEDSAPKSREEGQ